MLKVLKIASLLGCLGSVVVFSAEPDASPVEFQDESLTLHVNRHGQRQEYNLIIGSTEDLNLFLTEYYNSSDCGKAAQNPEISQKKRALVERKIGLYDWTKIGIKEIKEAIKKLPRPLYDSCIPSLTLFFHELEWASLLTSEIKVSGTLRKRNDDRASEKRFRILLMKNLGWRLENGSLASKKLLTWVQANLGFNKIEDFKVPRSGEAIDPKLTEILELKLLLGDSQVAGLYDYLNAKDAILDSMPKWMRKRLNKNYWVHFDRSQDLDPTVSR